jgi:hypothetical protein
MKNQVLSGIIAIATLLASYETKAQTPVQWERTLQLEGVWSGLAELNLGGQIFNVVYNTDFRLVIDGNGMTMDEGFSDPNLGELKGANLIGYSPYDDQIHWFSVDNFGTAHEHTGTWLNPKHFRMEHHSTMDGLPFSEYIDFRLRANNTRMRATLVATLGPDTIQTIDGILYLQSGSNRNGDLTMEKEESIQFYPNPSHGTVYIENEIVMDEILVFNESGQVVYESQPSVAEFELKLNESGIYLIQVISEGETITHKIVVDVK